VWQGRGITLNRGRLGRRWFMQANADTDALLLHEFAHHRVHDHLAADYADEVARLAARFIDAIFETPDLLSDWRGGAWLGARAAKAGRS
jgi:hypothetical protein